MSNSIRNILLIEDNIADVELIREMLNEVEGSYALTEAGRLSSGLKILKEDAFDIILLDLELPDSSGIDTFLTILDQASDVPVIILTVFADEKLAAEAISQGGQDYLIKGRIDSILLERSIRYAIDRKRSEAKLRRMSRRTELILETAGEGILGLDTEGTIIFLNNAAAAMLGYTTDEVIGKNCLIMFHHSTLGGIPYPAEKCPVDAAFRHDSDQYGEEVFWRKDGSSFPVYFTSRPLYEENKRIGAVVTFRDISERKRAEEALRESEERFRQMADAMPQLVWTADHDGRVDYYNKRVNEFEGFELKPDGSWHWQPVLHPDDLEPTNRVWQHALETGSIYEIEHRVRKRDGAYHWYLSRGEPVRDNAGRIIKWYGTATNINAFKLAQEALRESEERFRTAFENAATGRVLTGTDGRFIRTNKSFCEMLGYSEEEIASLDFASLTHPDDLEISRETVRALLTGERELQRFEKRYLHKDGHTVWTLVSTFLFRDQMNQPLYFITDILDITERKKVEEQLKRAKELSDALNRINTVIHSTLDLDAIMQRVVVEAAQAIHVEASSIGLFEGPAFVMRYMHNMPQDLMGQRLTSDSVRGVYCAALAKDVVASNEVSQDNRVNVWFWRKYGIKSLMIAPLILREQVIGALTFYSISKALVFTDIHIDFARKLTTSLSLALENSRLFNDRKKMEEEMRQMAHHDPLTGLPNRRLFMDIMKVELNQANRHRKKMAILFLDLDRFKEVNDTLGHEAGDLILKEAASRLGTAVRKSDTIARIGGDEFNVILADIVRPEDIADIARKIVEAFRKPYRIMGHDLHSTTSIGISVYPDDSEETDTLLKYADIAMYNAKENGRNKYQFYNVSINFRSLERMRLENMLHRSLELGEMQVFYQPLVNIRTQRIVCAETLARWQHPYKGLLEAKEFIPAAEETGFISAIDEWTLKKACRQVRAWRNSGLSSVCVTVNLSARQFQNPHLVERVTSILHETGTPPSCLDIEITESTAMSNVEDTAVRLKQLAEMGIHISIDDFGTGYSSLSRLKRLPIKRLKIDQSFIRDISGDPDDKTIVRAVTAMAHNMNIIVVAEGVETEEQLEFLRKTGCDEMQGFLFSKPLPAEKFRELMSKR